MSEEQPRTLADTARLAALVVLWAAAFRLLSAHGVDLLPRAWAGQLTLEEYLAGVQLLTLGIGLLAARLLLPSPRRTLAVAVPSPNVAATVLALAPALFAVTTTIAFFVAKPTLLAELAAGGRELAQKNTGQFGRELTQSPALLALLWGAVLSPIGEETFFRGALWALAQSAFVRLAPSSVAPRGDGLDVPLDEGAVVHATRAVRGWLATGGASTLAIGALFGLLHWDMPGGLGIVRFVSALGLGVACGIARHATHSVVAPMLLHVAFNTLSIAAVRRWVVTASFPVRYGAPTLVTALGLALFLGTICAHVLSQRGRAT